MRGIWLSWICTRLSSVCWRRLSRIGRQLRRRRIFSEVVVATTVAVDGGGAACATTRVVLG